LHELSEPRGTGVAKDTPVFDCNPAEEKYQRTMAMTYQKRNVETLLSCSEAVAGTPQLDKSPQSHNHPVTQLLTADLCPSNKHFWRKS